MKGNICLKKGIILLLVITIANGILKAQTPDANGIVYVNKNIAASGVGNSWGNATKELADALKAAKTNTAIKEIWVAKGTYYPKYSPANNNFGNNANKDNSFLMVKDVKLFGGFDPANSMTTMATRNPKNAVTILSGDIDQNNAITNNVFHVLIATGDVGTAELDGFSITGGNADNSASGTFFVGTVNIPRYEGGGIYINGSSPVMNQLIVNANKASQSAGVNFVNSAASIRNTIITNNTAVNYFGGGMSTVNSPVSLTNILFNDNKATSASGRGGALYITNCAPLFTNVTISNNTAAAGGGIYNLYNGKPVFRNSILYANAPNNLANNSGDSYAEFSYSLIGGSGGSCTSWVSFTGVDGGNNIDANPNFTNPAGNDYSLQDGSPAMGKGSNALFAGLTASTKDLSGNPRLAGANIDMGAYENQTPLPVIFGNVQAAVKDGQLIVQWQTQNETNNDHFLIQVSEDGNNWTTVQTIQSKAIDGNSSSALDYSISIPFQAATATAAIILVLVAASNIGKRKYFIIACLFLCSALFSCHKEDVITSTENQKTFIRIVQVDKDGVVRMSKIIIAGQE
ncbi:MAG: hypothetical protein IPH58_15855 [Sphingobacteriales bacterium]|nr:hypothetical protein [Sphingobacteriales bacterium]